MALSVIMTEAGATPTDVTTIRDTLDADITQTNPGYTSNLPGTLVEDLLSTVTAGVAACDQARVESINSVSAIAVNESMLDQLAAAKGFTRSSLVNTRAYVSMSGAVGTIIDAGFEVSDGTYTYATTSSVVISSTGTTSSLVLVVATQSGSWIPAAGSITTVVTQPDNSTITVNNPSVGIAGGEESYDDFRQRILEADAAGVQGSPSYLKSQVKNVPGVVNRTVSVKSYSNGYLVTASGGDLYEIANALYQSIGDITLLRGSTLSVTGATNAGPCVITTSSAHGLSTGDSATIAGALGLTAINGTFSITKLTSTTFSIAVDTTSDGTYTGGGYLVNNAALQNVTLYDGADSYDIVFIVPLVQTIGLDITWSEVASASDSDGLIGPLAQSAATDYVNSLSTGATFSLLALRYSILQQLSGLVSISSLTRFDISVTVDGVAVEPTEGEYLVTLDSLSYPLTSPSSITVSKA